MDNSSDVKYILCRRDIDGFNHIVKAGPKALSTIGIVDFKTFILEHNLHPMELAQFLKINHEDIQCLVDQGGWIEPHAKANLLQLTKTTCSRSRREICHFLMTQGGNAGSQNIPHKNI